MPFAGDAADSSSNQSASRAEEVLTGAAGFVNRTSANGAISL